MLSRITSYRVIQITCLTLGLVCWPFSLTFAQIVRPSTEVIEKTTNGEINWTSGWAHATGTGYPPNNAPASLTKTLGERAGYALALRNLLEVIKGVRVDSESLVQGHMNEDQVVKAKVSGLVQGAQIVRSQVKGDGGIEVQVKVPLWGIDSGAFVSTFRKPGANFPSVPSPPIDAAVLVDARGLGMTPALLPSIVNDEGKEVYSPSNIDPTILNQAGPAKYFSLSKDIDLQSYLFPNAYMIRPVIHAHDVLPLGSSMPLSVRAVKVVGTMRSTLVIASHDVDRLKQDNGAVAALRHGKIIIVMDPLVSSSSSSRESSD